MSESSPGFFHSGRRGTSASSGLGVHWRRMIDPELKQYLESMRSEIKTELESLRSEFKSDIERVETALLTAFHNWASPAEARARTHTATLRAIDLESLSERVQKLEDRK